MVTGAEAHGWLNDDDEWVRRAGPVLRTRLVDADGRTRRHIPRGRDDDVPDANGTKACLRSRGPVFIADIDRLYRGVGKFDSEPSGGTVAFARTGKEHAPVVRRAFVDGRRVVVHERCLQQFRDGMDVERGPGTNAVVHRLAEDVFDPIEQSLVGVL